MGNEIAFFLQLKIKEVRKDAYVRKKFTRAQRSTLYTLHKLRNQATCNLLNKVHRVL
jgi:hypothetical protein